MRPLRYSINVTLDGCCDHRAILADEDLHRHAVENIGWAETKAIRQTCHPGCPSSTRSDTAGSEHPGTDRERKPTE